MMGFAISQRLPGLNEYIAALDYSKYKGHKLKQSTEEDICNYILVAKSKGTLKPVENYPIKVSFEWHETTKRRDLDNIASAKKYVLDAMQKAGIIKGDGQKYVGNISDTFCIPSNQDGVIVRIEEMEKSDATK